MIQEKLALIQKELFVPKGNKNDFGKYNYRSCEDILKKVKPLCEKHGCVLRLTNEVQNVGDRYYVNAVAVLTELDTGEDIISQAQAREADTKKGMDDSQITGTASSYARKYALAGLFCIDNEKDADTNEYAKKQNEAEEEEVIIKPDKVATKDQRDKISKLIEEKRVSKEQWANIKDKFKFDKLELMSDVKANMVIAHLQEIEV